MSMEKRNVVEPRRTPGAEVKSAGADWDKTAAAEFVNVADAMKPEGTNGSDPKRT